MSERTSPLAQLFAVESEHDWRTLAACRGLDPDHFFAGEDLESKQERDRHEAAAKAVCAGCQVRQACLDYAITAGERYGVWGGFNGSERRSLIRRRRSVEETSLPGRVG